VKEQPLKLVPFQDILDSVSDMGSRANRRLWQEYIDAVGHFPPAHSRARVLLNGVWEEVPAQYFDGSNWQFTNVDAYRNGAWSHNPTPPVAPFSATGGTKTTVGPYTYHTYKYPGDDVLACIGSILGDAFLEAGGGGGGFFGGGGGGGYIVANGITLGGGDEGVEVDMPVTVGDGGYGLTASQVATDGLATLFAGYTALGGGHGGNAATAPGSPGGSGGAGGVGNWQNGNQTAGGLGTDGQGYAGGSSSQYGGGGGGGASENGDSVAAYGSNIGNGGDGIEWPPGSGKFYGGGGGGGASYPGLGQSSGGVGGGGKGEWYDSEGTYWEAEDGVNRTGGGGGGGCGPNDTHPAGAGGSGTLIVRYLTP